MIKNKVVVIAMAGLLAMCFGLTACGGSSSASSSAASSSAASSSAASSSAASSSAASDSAASTSAAVLEAIFWQGTLPDGQTVSYVDDAASGAAALCVAKSDFSDAAVWVGPLGVSPDGVITVTDADTGKTITFSVTGVTADSYTIDLAGYGEVELKPVTEADIKAYAEDLAAAAASEGEKLVKQIETAAKDLEKELTEQVEKLQSKVEKLQSDFANLDEKTALFWNGALADGSNVYYVDDPDNGKAYLAVIKADYSDGAAWYGKTSANQDGKIVTITDDETGKTVVYEVVESTPDTSMKVNVKGYGEANLKPVTKGDFTKSGEELAKLLGEGAAK